MTTSACSSPAARRNSGTLASAAAMRSLNVESPTARETTIALVGVPSLKVLSFEPSSFKVSSFKVLHRSSTRPFADHEINGLRMAAAPKRKPDFLADAVRPQRAQHGVEV